MDKRVKDTFAEKQNIEFSQQGVPYFPDHARFVTLHFKSTKKADFKRWRDGAAEAKRFAEERGAACIAGVDHRTWRAWAKEQGMPVPRGLTSDRKLKQRPFAHTGGDAFFHIKADSAELTREIADKVTKLFDGITKTVTETEGRKRPEGKVIGGRFRDAMINPVDPVNLSTRCIVGEEDAFYRGASYMIEQKFKHNWARLDDMTMVEKENMIGRNHDDSIIPQHDDRSHIKCVRQLNGERVTQRILRQAIPFGEAPEGGGREEGVFFIAYTNDGDVYEELIDGITGSVDGFVKDKLLSNTLSESGNFWFVPPAGLITAAPSEGRPAVPLNNYYDYRSPNGYMYYNNRDFLHSAQEADNNQDVPISDRIMALLGQTFSRWNDTWAKQVEMPTLGHLQDYVGHGKWKKDKYIKIAESGSVAVRKGLCIKISLSDVLLRDVYRDRALLFNIKPYEVIVGNMPPLTLGTGTQVMEYLSEEERLAGYFGKLNEYSATGHNVPDYAKAIRLGIPGMIHEAKAGMRASRGDKKDFYHSVLLAMEGLQAFIRAYADLAKEMARKTEKSDKLVRSTYDEVHQRMKRLAEGPPAGFHDQLQLIFIINCALHQTGEPMSIGRLDQYLADAYNDEVRSGLLTPSSAQELMDAFWLKMDETVLYNRQNMKDYLNYGTGAVFYSAGNFPQGSALNQWVQQVTIGGYLPTDDEDGIDGCNGVTLLCLRSARRLPLNAPCLSLRVHGKMTGDLHQEIIAEASRAILAGGAHPILMNDDKLCSALEESAPTAPDGSRMMSKADSRDYVCDGCYEPIIGGKSEWAFSYVPILPVVGMAMNQGATIAGAGWIHLRGLKSSWNSPAPEDIESFDAFLEIFFKHYSWQIASFYNTLMHGYGALGGICPSPLFSAFVEGCMESGRDMSNGGATHHIVAPMMCGITNAIDAIYAIKKMVYDEETAITTLPELRMALFNNWGEGMQEPFENILAGDARSEAVALRYRELREAALALPKFGEGNSAELKDLAEKVVGRCVEIIHDGINNPIPPIAQAYEALKKKYSLPGRPFYFTVTPGVGTFEDNLGLGVDMGASADGRLSGQPVADDFCAAPIPDDKPATGKAYDLRESLKDWNIPAINHGLSNAAPIDLNIREDFAAEDLETVIRLFAGGDIGSNLITVTTADPETYAQAKKFPERYDLVRVRQGGWSEFFVAMFPEHQDYIPRRPYYAFKK